MVVPQVGDAFGQERILTHSCRLLIEAGCAVSVVADRQVGEAPAGVQVHLIPGLSSFHNLSSPVVVRRAVSELQRFVAGFDPDILHWHDCFDARFVQGVSDVAPSVLTAHTVAPSCPSSARLVPGASHCERKSGWACLAHNAEYGCLGFLKSDLHRAHAIYNYLSRRRALQKHMRYVLCISDYVTQTLARDGWDPARLRSVPNPVLVPPPQTIEVPNPLFVFAARLSPLKGLRDLLHALRLLRHRSWNMWVCGDGAERAALEQLCHSLELKARVKFLGRTSPERTASILASATALIAPNQGPETFGLSVAEACAYGLPVVAYDVPALNEMIKNGETGQTVRLGDRAALARALSRVLDQPEIAKEMALRAQTLVRERFSGPAHLAALLGAYTEAAGVPQSAGILWPAEQPLVTP